MRNVFIIISVVLCLLCDVSAQDPFHSRQVQLNTAQRDTLLAIAKRAVMRRAPDYYRDELPPEILLQDRELTIDGPKEYYKVTYRNNPKKEFRYGDYTVAILILREDMKAKFIDVDERYHPDDENNREIIPYKFHRPGHPLCSLNKVIDADNPEATKEFTVFMYLGDYYTLVSFSPKYIPEDPQDPNKPLVPATIYYTLKVNNGGLMFSDTLKVVPKGDRWEVLYPNNQILNYRY